MHNELKVPKSQFRAFSTKFDPQDIRMKFKQY